MTLISIEPATGAELWVGTAGDVEQEIATARAAWRDWALTPLNKRVSTMRRFAAEAEKVKEEFADLIARETGKPLWEARSEVASVIAKVEISIKAHGERTGNRVSEGKMGLKASLRHKPHGVMAVLGPYNLPAHLPNGHMIPALLAGNVAVFKPSEKTPAVGEYLVNLYHQAGIPEGVVRLLIGGPEEGKALTRHPGIDGVLFTGSATVGMALSKYFATRPGPILALEMGGNNPVVVWDTHDLDSAAALVVQSAFMSAGQRCSAARRLIIKEGMFDAVIERVSALAGRLIVDHPHADPEPFMGPVIDNIAAEGLTESFLYLMSNGGKVIRHLQRPNEDLPFLTPGIIDMSEASEQPDVELFGPLLQCYKAADLDGAIAEANNTMFGLSASLIGGSEDEYEQFVFGVRAGVINHNMPTSGASSHQPFGGVGLSGNHRPSAYYAADYCAYPVASTQMAVPRTSLKLGVAPEEK